MKEEKALEIHMKMKKVITITREKMIKNLKSLGLTAPQAMIIGTIMRRKQLKISEISNTLSLSNATVSKIIDRLENQKKVIRIKDDKDKRKVYVKLTDNFKKELLEKEKSPENCIVEPLMYANIKELEKVDESLDLILNILERKEKNK